MSYRRILNGGVIMAKPKTKTVMKSMRFPDSLRDLSLGDLLKELEIYSHKLESVWLLQESGEKDNALSLHKKLKEELGNRIAKMIEDALEEAKYRKTYQDGKGENE
jgi:hypothetical protein